MEGRRPAESGMRRVPLLPMPRLCLRPDGPEDDRASTGLACPRCVPGGCVLAIGWGPGRDPEGRR